MKRFIGYHFNFDVENYMGQAPMVLKKHIKIYCKGEICIDLLLDPEDVKNFKKVLDYDLFEPEKKDKMFNLDEIVEGYNESRKKRKRGE